MTRGEEMIATARSDLADLRKIGHGAYTRRDIAKIIDPLGSRLETFLRAVALPMASRRHKLVQLIDQLETAGLPNTDVETLHALRILYNASKHDPAEPLLLANAILTVKNAVSALEALCDRRIGATAAEFGHELTYHLWVGFWDHFTGGMTDIAVMLPGEHWTHVSTVDALHMNISEWDSLKPILEPHKRFGWGENISSPPSGKACATRATS